VTGSSTSPASERLFFALWPQASVQAEIAVFTDQLGRIRGRRMADENVHLTLVFLGQVGAEQRAVLTAMAASLHAAPFTLTLDQCGGWSRSRVLWLAPVMMPEALTTLHSALDAGARRVGQKTEQRAYRPHLTLFRDVIRIPKVLPAPAIHWPVTDFVLVHSETRSTGPHYTVQQRWQLNG